jgi:Fe-S cluster assembly iron-binding protein IscA
MDSLSMKTKTPKVPKNIKDKLFKYGVNLPTKGSTNAYKNILIEKNLTEKGYVSYLKDTIAKLKKKEDKKIKQIIKQVKDAKIKEKARENAREKPIRYVGTINIKYLVLNKDGKNEELKKTLIFDRIVIPSQLEEEIFEITNDDYEEVEDESWVLAIESQDVKTTIKPVENTGRMENIRMRKSGAGLIDGYDKQDWDTNTGRCVFDYIISRYGNIKGFKNVCNYEDLNNIFDNSIWEEEKKDLLNVGVNTIEIQRFCERFKLPMYAIDDNEKCFKQYTPQSRNKNAPAMIYRVSNEHFYPCPNKKIQSIIQTTSTINNIDSVMTRNNFKVKDDEEEIKEYENVNIEYVDDIMDKLIEVINNGGIPEKVNMLKKKLFGFKYGNNTYVSNENIDLIKKLCSNMKIEYIGQSLGGIFKIILKDVIGNEELPKSTHNNYVFNILKDAKKNRARRGAIKDLDELENKENLKAFDLIKCYSSCMYNPTYDWIITDYNDTWEDYDGEIKLGLYYVITEDTKLFKKSGYYSTCIIDKAIKENIEFKITKQLISKEKESKDLFKNIIDKILLYCDGDEKISKLVINLMSGMLGQSEKEGTKVKINSDIKQIFNFLDKYYQLEEGIMINQIENTDYFIYGFNKKITMNETNIPMYIQLLDESNIKLYDMIKNIGGELVAVKVDCAIIKNPINRGSPPERVNNLINQTDKWGKYIECDIPIITQNEICEHIDFTADNEWRDYDYNDSDNWEDIMEVLDKKGGLLLQASAGNGKTYVAKQIAKKLMEKGYGVKIIAPTNKAGLNIGGSTIHKFLKIDKEGNISSKLLKIVKEKYQYIIIDEISMIGKELWKRINLLKINSNIKFLLLGDEKQCPPVENEDIEDYFNHSAVKSICNYNRNVLDVRKRYDEKLYNILEDVNNIKIDYIKEPLTERNICYFNKTRKRINKYWNDKKKKDGDLFILADEENDKTQDMYIYEGLPVIAMKTKHDGDNILFANSETFNVGNIDNEYISLCCERPDENGEKEIYIYDCPIEDFRDYFLLNYCSTTHKSQGETITEEYTIYDWDCMTTKIKYTALSRAVKYENVYFGYGERE